jgi:hypothetical protein
MWYFLIKSAASAILGSATESWFRKTRLGVWFYAKVDRLYTWAAKRYNIKLAQDATDQKNPALELEIKQLKNRVDELEKLFNKANSK